MNKLPDIQIQPASTTELIKLQRWLQAFEIDRALEDDEAAKPSVAGKEYTMPSWDLDSNEPFAAGQIRLMKPIDTITASRLVYFVLINQNSDGQWLAAPFSRYTEPAVPEEWKRGAAAACVRVLCFWNTRVLSNEKTTSSWVADSLSTQELQTAQAMWSAVAHRQQPPVKLSRNCGPPLLHPMDPRHEYLEAEKDALCFLGSSVFTRRKLLYFRSPSETYHSQYLRAAEPRRRYGERDDGEKKD